MPCQNHPEVHDQLAHCSRCGAHLCPDCRVNLQGLLYCINCKEDQLHDLACGVNPTQLEQASLGARFAAYAIDLLILYVPTFVLMFSLVGVMAIVEKEFGAEDAKAATSLAIWVVFVPIYLLSLIAPLGYEFLMLSRRNGQTVGKRAMGIRVVTPEGAPLTGTQAFIRSLIRYMVMMFCYGLPDYIPAFFDRDRKTIHDIVAKTRVIYWQE